MTAAAVWGLIVLLPGAIVHPSVAFADVERAMKRVRTAAWIQTESMYVDGVEEYAVVTEHWARLTPPAYATRNRPDRRRGHVNTGQNRTLIDENGTIRFNARANRYTLTRTNLTPGVELQNHVRELIMRLIAAPAQSAAASARAGDSRLVVTPWTRRNVTVKGRRYVEFRQSVTGRPPGKGYTPSGRVSPSVRTLWVDPATRLVRRAETRGTDPWAPSRTYLTVMDQVAYDSDPPPGVFDLTPPPSAQIAVEDWRRRHVVLTPEQRLRVQRAIDQSERAWVSGDFAAFSSVWDFAYLRPQPNTEHTYRSEVWARKSWQWWVEHQRNRWRSWRSEVPAIATGTRYGGWEGAFLPEDDPDLLEVKVITRARGIKDTADKAWDPRYYLRQIGNDYRITHWSYRWPFSPIDDRTRVERYRRALKKDGRR